MIHIDIRSNFSILCPNFSRQCYNHSRWLSNFSRFSFQFFKCTNTFLVLSPLRGPLEVVAEALELSESRASASLNNQGPFSLRIPNNQTVSKKSNKKTFCSQHICGFFCRGGGRGYGFSSSHDKSVKSEKMTFHAAAVILPKWTSRAGRLMEEQALQFFDKF